MAWLPSQHALISSVCAALQQVERVISVSTKTCYDRYSKYVCFYYTFSCHSIPAMLKRVYYMAVSICCSALLTCDTSQMAEYTLNELTDMHLLYLHICGMRMDSKRKRTYCTYRSKSLLTPWWPFQLVADTAAQTELIGACCDGSRAIYP